MKIAQNNLKSPEFAKAVATYPTAKRALCFGDSWFQYVPHPTDINKQLARVFKGTLFLSKGVAGRDSARWKIGLPEVLRAIGNYQFDAILLSTGGNDVAGKELREFVKTAEQPQSPGSTAWGEIPAAVRDHIRLETFEHALRYVIKDIKEVVQYRDMNSHGSTIYLHTYDHIWPTGIPFKLAGVKAGPWVKPHFDRVGLTDPQQQRIVAKWLIDQFARELRAFASQHPNMTLVDSRGTLTSKQQWENEIHPTAKGFELIARQCWVPRLTGVLR